MAIAELGRLKAYGAEDEPRMGAFDVGSHENGYYKEQNHYSIDGICVCFIKPVVEKEYYASYDERKPYPKELFA